MKISDILFESNVPAELSPDADFEALMSEEHLGTGNSRNVYRHATDPSLVVKENFQGGGNSLEWETWNWFKGTEFEQYLAPCLSISESTEYMIQKFADDCSFEGEVPLFMLLLDPFPVNFGKLDGRIVMRDYDWRLVGLQDIMNQRRAAMRMINASSTLLMNLRCDFEQKFEGYSVGEFIAFIDEEKAWVSDVQH